MLTEPVHLEPTNPMGKRAGLVEMHCDWLDIVGVFLAGLSGTFAVPARPSTGTSFSLKVNHGVELI